jgi:hypothetical protein
VDEKKKSIDTMDAAITDAILADNGRFDAVVDEVFGASERAGAIVSVAYIEDKLVRAIKNKLRHLSAGEERALFSGPRAPLGALSARILMGHALGLYSAAARDDLSILKDVRNAFAHELDIRAFSDPKIGKLTARLNWVRHSPLTDVETHPTVAFHEFHRVISHFVLGLGLLAGNRLTVPTISPKLNYSYGLEPRASSPKKMKVRVAKLTSAQGRSRQEGTGREEP